MRRFSVLISVLVAVLAGLLVAGRVANTVAQEGTPPAEEEFFEGLTFEPLGFGTAEELPAAPAEIALFRFGVDPGAGFPIEEDDPTVALVVVESGAVTFRVEAPVRVTRAATIAAFATPGAEEGAIPTPEEVAAGTEFTLEAGDSAVFPPNVPGEVRNDGAERAVGLVALIAPPEEAAATPVP